MKALAKPISSPSRGAADNFPPPLLRFLRSNGGSRSRGRSRNSSPIFIPKKASSSSSSQPQEQEPSSPKVTCMGQVRVTRSSNQNKNKKIKTNGYQWIPKTLFCCHLDKKSIPKGFWRRGFFPFYPRRRATRLEIKEEAKPEETTEEEEDDKAEIFITSTPPKNALMLMRCRSEPYRASSLANRFWGSPLTDQKQQEEEEEEEASEAAGEEEEENPTLEKEPICRDSALESRTDPETEEKLGFCRGLESSSSSTTTIAASGKTCIEIEAGTSKVTAPPLLLTRCKSEPGRRSEKFQQETCFWKKRLGFVDISTTRF